MLKTLQRWLLAGILTMMPAFVLAQSTAGSTGGSTGGPTGGSAGSAPRTLDITIGTALTFWELVQNIITFMAGSISAISVAMFVVGALLITLSGVKEDLKQRGKDLMIGSVLALAVVAGAYSILRTIDYFLT